MTTRQAKATDEQLLRAFYSAAIFAIDHISRDGWYWTSNYLREHARARGGLRFSNTRSPAILRLLARRHPELAPWIRLGKLKRPYRPDQQFIDQYAPKH